jgi:hypothetical protein
MKVRFHLQRGINYKKWQVRDKDNNVGKDIVTYYDPDTDYLLMVDCKLKNSEKIATRIFNGSNKTVCAWIECESIELLSETEYDSNLNFNLNELVEIKYNPRDNPYWVLDDKNVDGYEIKSCITKGNKVYILI